MNQFINLDQPEEGITRITLNRPERMNAMAFDVMEPLAEALQTVSEDNNCRVIILTGAGSSFCAGADLQDAGFLPSFKGLKRPAIARRAMRILDNVVHSIQQAHQPVIAAINGPAIGGGFCLAMCTDIRIAAQSACFRAAGINNGLTAAELGLSYHLPRAIGSTRAFEIMLSGRDVDAEEAARIGLVSETVAGDELMSRCLDVARRIMSFSHLGVELTKQLLWAGINASSLHTHMNHESHAQLYMKLTTGNFEEAIKARQQERTPVYEV
ncbi:enoyl-CoA hydratase [Pseudomaricurvus alkylphenolicus]|jgi:enoyl-CoA hydratase|uniref:enoyl-CoA hydratase n=1 Tax=Pseudomaricurvus alkylphenolicus TaxID=1306991 RepID=UPI00142193CA|nr:enoyl-CoA hydratase [Pseudomaricurvus alkylphenolicus]NIB42123.1 enoyl-CoA hydratase [Pseudomaricurvus alkylphenolicus]